jgi:hypothetical protein
VRVAFFLILLANLAFFAWAHWLAPKEATLPVSPKVDAPRLQLATEAQPLVANAGHCVTVGPFATNELAARARQTLTDTGYSSLPRQVTTSELDGFWVYLESPSTESGERRLLERLHRGGISDAQAVGEPGSRRISLGVFSDEARAAAQSERVAKLGVLPQIVARDKPATAIWLDLTLKSDALPLEGQKFKAGDTELEFRPCPTESGAPAGGIPAAQ